MEVSVFVVFPGICVFTVHNVYSISRKICFVVTSVLEMYPWLCENKVEWL